MKPFASKPINTWPGLALAVALALLGTGCGSGGEPGAKPAINSSSTAGEGGVTAAPRVTLALTDAAGVQSSVVTRSKPLTVVATVLDASGKPVANALTAFNVDATLATLSPASGTVATDAEGKARVTLTAASAVSAGAGALEVVALVGNQSAVAKVVFSAGPSKLSVRLVTPDANPLRLRAYDSSVIALDVLSDGQPMTSEAVSMSFSSPCTTAGKATLPVQVSTVNGRAQLVYRDQGCTQADIITATVTGANAAVTINVQVTSPDAASIQVASVEPSDRSIVIKGSGGSGRTETAIVKFKVVDQFGNAVPNQHVAFSSISTKAVMLSKASDVTDANGEVITALSSGTEPTAVRVRAVLDNGLSTISDTIGVTTGIPVQAAFSLSASSYNFEGFAYDNEHIDVNLLLADQFGNPVADGVPVVFQTDSGAIGSSGRGGCTSMNGACSVILRSQNPRYSDDATAPQGRAGMATISVSTLGDTSVPLTGQIAVFLSGSFATNIAVIGGAGATPVAGTLALSTNSCDAMMVSLRISDSHKNPLPSGTTLTFDSAVNLDGATIFPSTVPIAAPRYTGGRVVGDQGTVHLIPVRPSEAKCAANGANRLNGTTNVLITTPKGNVTLVPIKLSFPSL
jgi:hypothetical protein